MSMFSNFRIQKKNWTIYQNYGDTNNYIFIIKTSVKTAEGD